MSYYDVPMFEEPIPDQSCGPRAPRDVTAIYHVSVRIYDDGHACTQLGWVDMSSRRALSEKQLCYSSVRSTRLSVLNALGSAVTRALLDSRRSGD